MLCLDEIFCQSWNVFPIPESCWERSSLCMITNQQLPQTLLYIYSSSSQELLLSKGVKMQKKSFSVSCTDWVSTGEGRDSAQQWPLYLRGVWSVFDQHCDLSIINNYDLSVINSSSSRMRLGLGTAQLHCRGETAQGASSGNNPSVGLSVLLDEAGAANWSIIFLTEPPILLLVTCQQLH